MTRILTFLGSIVVTVALAVGLAPAAHASSTFCASYGNVVRWGVLNGSFCSSVNGSGTYIGYISGTYGTFVPYLNQVCNPSMKVDIYDRWGRWITWRQGPQAGGCHPWSLEYAPSMGVYATFPAAADGYARVTLQSYGAPVASNVHRFG